MGVLVFLALQAFDLDPAETPELPSIENLDWAPRRPVEERLSAEVFAVWTRFDDSIRIDDAWGIGGDVKVGLNWGSGATLVMRLGYAGWETDNDDQQTASGRTHVRQYRIGVGGDFSTRHVEFGIYAVSGLYHFHSRRLDNDTKGFFELMASIGAKPWPFLKIGVVGMVTCTSSDYNRGSSHLFTQHSIGPSIEFKFEF